MQCLIKAGNLTFTAEGNGQKDLFEQIAMIQEIFQERPCGKCKSTNVKYQVREVDDNKFYELECNECRYRFTFGQHKKGGTLYPHRDKGWHKFDPNQKKDGKN